MAARKPKPVNGTAKPKKVQETAYLTKRILVSASRKAFMEAHKEETDLLGYNIIAEDGWVLKVYPDGQREKISEIKHIEPKSGVLFD